MLKNIKRIIPKILFILTILFYIVLLGIAVIAAFTGTTFIFSKIYGFDAFLITLLALGFAFSAEVPIIPILVIYDIVYILRKTALKNLDTKKFIRFVILPLAAVAIIACAFFAWNNISYYAGKQIQKAEFNRMLKNKDEEVVYDNSDIYVDGILGNKDYTCSTIFMDYDKMTVGVLSTRTFGEYSEYKLKESSTEAWFKLRDIYYLQAEIPLKNGTLRAYSTTKDNTHRTIAFVFTSKDNKVYIKDSIEAKHDGLVTFLSAYQYSDAAISSKQN